jgi:hypothetical protein
MWDIPHFIDETPPAMGGPLQGCMGKSLGRHQAAGTVLGVYMPCCEWPAGASGVMPHLV